MRRCARYQPPPASTPSARKATFGIPGINPSTVKITADTASALGWPATWVSTAALMSCARDMRVTSTATAVESISAGICATRPSPMVSKV